MEGIDFKYMVDILPILMETLHTTMSISLISFIVSIVIATIMSLICFFKVKVLDVIVYIYISFFRGTPLLVQLFLLYFGLAKFIPIISKMTPYTAIIIGLSLNTSAYMAENIRGAIESVDKGQFEAATSIGMSKLQMMFKIIIPQALKVAIPSLVNNLVDVIKSSSLAITIGVTELMSSAQIEASATYKFLEAYLAVIIIYWIISLIISYIQKRLELRLSNMY